MARRDATPATLATVQKTAKPGDVLVLAPGDYRGARFNLATDLTVIAADPKNWPRFIGGASFSKCVGLRFEGVAFEMGETAVASANVLTLAGGERITITGCDFRGYEDAAGKRLGRGVVASGVNDLAITNNRFEGLFRSAVVAGSNGVRITENDMFDMGSDGINLGQVTRALVMGNQIDGFKPVAGNHPDAIQIMTTAAGAASQDVTIADNLIVGQGAQGIFVKAENKAVRHRSIKIQGNVVIDAGFHAITAGQADEVVIAGNVCLFRTRPDADKSWIKAEPGAFIRGNRAMRYLIDPADEKAGSLNEVIDPASDVEEQAAIAAWRKTWRPDPDAPKAEPVAPTDALTLGGKVYDVVLRSAEV